MLHQLRKHARRVLHIAFDLFFDDDGVVTNDLRRRADERAAVIPSVGGRITDEDGRPLAGEYVVGWIKRGPTGIIGTNKRDAQETVDALLADLDAGVLNRPVDPSRDSLEALLAERKPEHVTYTGWEAIDSVEKAAGEPHGRPRVKLTSFDELLDAAHEGEPASRS